MQSRCWLAGGKASFPVAWVALLCTSLLIFGCKGGAEQKPGAERTEIRIGATLPLTGAETKVGGFFKEGYELAVEEVNRAGGLDIGGHKLPVRLLLLDDTTNQATAVSLADRLINAERADFLLGTYSTPLVAAQSTVAEQNQVPYVNGGGGATEIYKRNYRYVFGLLAPTELLGDTLMRFIDERQQSASLPRPARIALVWENTAHGKDFQRGVNTFVAARPEAYSVVVDEAFELNGKDFSALLGKVKAASADLFLADAHLSDYITMQRQYVSAGLCHKVVTYGARGSEQGAVEALGQENVANILSAVWWSTALAEKNERARAFLAAYQAKYHKSPDWYQALSYEAARVLFAAIEQAKTVDREAVRNALAALTIDSLVAGGKLSFPAEYGQQAHYPFVVQQNQAGRSPAIFPHDVATAEAITPDPRCAKAQ
jgi:branched-chain amino acid transport system substrate-binding protein